MLPRRPTTATPPAANAASADEPVRLNKRMGDSERASSSFLSSSDLSSRMVSQLYLVWAVMGTDAVRSRLKSTRYFLFLTYFSSH